MAKARDGAREAASPHKLAKARERGEVACSREWTTAGALLGGLAGAWWCGPEVLTRLLRLFTRCLSGGLAAEAWVGLDLIAHALACMGGGALLGAVAAGASQVGLRLTWRRKPGRLNPIRGLGRMWSSERLRDCLWLLARLAGLAAVAVGPLWSRGPSPPAGQPAQLAQEAAALADGLLALILRLAGCAVLLALADRWRERRRFLRQQRMTRAEVMREHKEQQGDPAVRAERRRRHRQLLAGGLALLPRARVVVVNPVHAAVALAYDPERDEAPVVLVAGWRQAARRIRERALQLGLPLVTEVPLARALADHPWGEAIPQDLYRAAAAVIGALEQPRR